MNWLLIIVIIVMALSILRGLQKGLVKTVISTFFLAIVIIASIWAAPYVSKALNEYTPINTYFTEKAENFLADFTEDTKQNFLDSVEADASANGTVPDAAIEAAGGLSGDGLSLSDAMLRGMLKDEAEKGANAVTELNQKLASSIGNIVVQVIAFIGTFVIACILLIIIMKLLDSVMDLPVLGFVNTLGGGVAGLIRAFLFIWVFFTVVSMSYHTEWGAFCYKAIEENQFLRFLYSNNFIVSIIKMILQKM